MNTNTNTDNSYETWKKKLGELLSEGDGMVDYQANYIAELLGDQQNLKYYRILVRNHDPMKLIRLAQDVKDRDMNGLIRTKRAVYFIGILKRLGMQSKFRKDRDE